MTQHLKVTAKLPPIFAAAMLALTLACSGGDTPVDDVVEDAVDGDTLNGDTATIEDAMDRDNTVSNDTAVDGYEQDATVSQTALDLVAQGKAYLSKGESLSAIDSFQVALQIEPDLDDAMWGMVLGRFQATVSLYSSLAGLINYEDDPDAVPPTTLRSLTWTDHEGTMGDTVDTMWYSAVEQKERIDTLKADTDAVFNLPGGLPLYFRDDQMMNLCCNWDIGDLYGISSFNNLMLALVSFLGSQNMDINFGVVEDIADTVPGTSNLIVELLEMYPDAFKLQATGGADMWKATGDFLLASTEDALESARLMADGNDDEDAVATLTDDEHPYLELHGTFPDGSSSLELLWDGYNVSLKDVVERANAHLGGAADSQLSLDGDVLVAISVLVDIINRTIGIDKLVSGLGISLPDIVVGLLGSLDKNDPEQLAGMLPGLTSLLGIQSGTIYLDLAGFFGNPFNLRDFFPNWGDDPGTSYKTFVKSFECVRAGTTYDEPGVAKVLSFWVHDPKLETAPTLVIRTSPSNPPGDVTSDEQSITLTAYTGFSGLEFKGLYVGGIQLVTGDTPTASDDGTVALPAEGGLVATYTWEHDGGGSIAMGGGWTEWSAPWDYGAACGDDQTPWDGAHFGEGEFADAVEVTAPGQTTPVSEIAADGKSMTSGLMAFKSPSFNGLLWVKSGDEMAPTDQATFAGLFAGVLDALEGF